MRLRAHPLTALTTFLLLSPPLAAAYNIDCEHVRIDRKSYSFKALDGLHSLSSLEESKVLVTNTTFSLNICKRLERLKGVPKEEDCPSGSHVCAIPYITNTVENSTITGEPVVVAGEFSHTHGGALDPKWTRRKPSASPADGDKEGIRLEMHGGQDTNGKKAKAVVDFICISKEEQRRRDILHNLVSEDEDDRSRQQIDDGDGGTIKFLSWEYEDDEKVLRLEWDTEHACEDAHDGGKSSKSGHWGFFTWFIIIVFMGVAAYLIFGSWLNYNRYSARGWDLVPHSDSLRDIPYLLRDWMRRVVDTIQGGGSRGGYSAV